jgi:hypothetical protein
MVELSTIRDLVAIFGVIAGFSYYVLTVRNAQRNQQHQLETRQAQLFMNLYETWSTPEFRKRSNWVNQHIEYEDSEDFHSKYGRSGDQDAFADWASVAAYYEGIGVLVRRGLIDIGLVSELLSNSIRITWEKMGPEFLESRALGTGHQKLFYNFEFLYNEIKKREASLADL